MTRCLLLASELTVDPQTWQTLISKGSYQENIDHFLTSGIAQTRYWQTFIEHLSANLSSAKMAALTNCLQRREDTLTILEPDVNNNILHAAAKFSDVFLCEKALAAGADPNAFIDDETVLHVANDAEIIKKLIKAGANISEPDRYNKTPLQSASRAGRYQAVRELLKQGAPLEELQWKRICHHPIVISPLLDATCKDGNFEDVRFILKTMCEYFYLKGVESIQLERSLKHTLSMLKETNNLNEDTLKKMTLLTQALQTHQLGKQLYPSIDTILSITGKLPQSKEECLKKLNELPIFNITTYKNEDIPENSYTCINIMHEPVLNTTPESYREILGKTALPILVFVYLHQSKEYKDILDELVKKMYLTQQQKSAFQAFMEDLNKQES